MNRADFSFDKKIITQFMFSLLLITTLYTFLSDSSLNLAWFQDNLQRFRFYADNYFLLTVLIFFLLRFFFAVVSIPGSGVLTIAAGALFDFWLASIIVSLAVSSGVLVVFLLSRYAFRSYVEEKSKDHFALFDQLAKKYGLSLLFLLRVTEIIPSFVINSGFAVTPIKAINYYWVSFVGQLPGILIFINAGHQITEIREFSDLYSLEIILSLAALGFIPLVSKLIYSFVVK